MKKLLILITAVTALWLTPALAHAQSTGPSDCDSTVYDNEFSCSKESVYSYCTLSASAFRSGPDYNLYEESYCDTIRDDDDDIYEIIAEQFKAEYPDIDEDEVELILKNTYVYKDEQTGQASGLTSSRYRRVKSAYDREKILYQTQKSLESQFKASEIWVNGSLSDSPFDLIVDLNLIEMILFGSQAQWQDDVYAWPSGGSDKDNPGIGPATFAGQTPGADAATSPTTSPATSPTTSPSDSPDDYECVSDDSLEDVINDQVSNGSSGGTSGSGTSTTSDSNPGQIPANCGNGTKDSGEECDDSNNLAGDGCSEACKLEITTSLSCQDTEAVTLKQFKDTSGSTSGGSGAGTGSNGSGTGTGNGDSSDSTPPISCPPGSTATKKDTDSSSTAPTQSANYPGPFVGGVLKKMPKSKKTDCPPGTSYVEMGLLGSKEPTCVPKLCANFDKLRFTLFPEYKALKAKEDRTAAEDLKLAGMEAVEASICVDIKKVDRPESPYPTNEGCIDCHILAMVDIMDETHQKNIVPRENNMQSWGTSNRWGPSIAFNLNTVTKMFINPLTTHDLRPFPTDKEKADLYAKNSEDTKAGDAKDPPAPASTVSSEDSADTLSRELAARTSAKDEYKKSLKNYKLVGDATGDQIAHEKIIARLNDMKAIFQNIQDKWGKLSKIATGIKDKEMCTIQ